MGMRHDEIPDGTDGPRRLGVGGLKWAFVATFSALFLLQLWAFLSYRIDSRQLEGAAATLTQGTKTEREKLGKIVDFVAFGVANPPVLPDGYFFHPVFRMLKPTALQVVDAGGDCAYKARAAIVLLDKLGIHATKLALYDKHGKPQHAVALADTAQGKYVVDLLYGFIFENEDGSPTSLSSLEANPQVLHEALDRFQSAGHPRAALYPVERYTYAKVRTINWHKNGALAFLYGGLTMLLGQDRVDSWPRPYLVEEPALMVIVGALLLQVALVLGALVPWFFRVRRRRRVLETETSAQDSLA